MSIFEAQRKKSKVCRDTLRLVVFREEKVYQNLKAISEYIQKLHPAAEMAKFHELSREEQIKYAYKVYGDMIRGGHMDTTNGQLNMELFFLFPFELTSGVSALMVRPLIETLCSEPQKAKWLPLFHTSRIVGAYAQTEMGHGSDVQSLETEAHYDEKTKEFVINSPTVSSRKWWPGELSNVSTIAVVYAKTFVKGRKIGVLPFIVPIRDMHTHKPLPGVEIGDIGPKMGYGAKENGFLSFDHVRIPLDHMPNRFMEITPEGNVVQKGNPKIIYTSMMKSRTALLGASSFYIGKGAAIAIRYSFLRKQFKNDQKEEIPVIQYQLQRFKLFPLLAKSYVIQGAYIKILELVRRCDAEVATGNFQNLQETHVILSGGKAFYTWWCVAALNTCMQCCGGHGYSQYSGIPSLLQNFAPNTILEGENTMLLLQVGRFLLKNYRYVMEGKAEKIHGYATFFKDMDGISQFNTNLDQDLTSIDSMKRLWQRAVVTKVGETIEAGAEHASHLSMLDTWNKKIGIQVFESAKLYSILFTYDFFVQYVATIAHGPTKEAMLKLARLFIIDQTLECAGMLVAMKVIGAQQIKALQKEFEELLDALFDDALVLAEGWVIDDFSLHSAIAHSNEKPYDNLYQLAKTAGVLNRTDLTGAYLDTVRKASLEAFPQPKL